MMASQIETERMQKTEMIMKFFCCLRPSRFVEWIDCMCISLKTPLEATNYLWQARSNYC